MAKMPEQMVEAFITSLGLNPDEAQMIRDANQEEMPEPTGGETSDAVQEPSSPRRRRTRDSKGDGAPGQRSVSSSF